ncbi:MAG TPA: TonB-dependent receptor, partial [Rhizomicrobium sp.]|nr:TonB-dependent receptor [Rhizomicrobium sp.]
FTSTADAIRSISADNAGSLSNAFNGAFATGAAAVSLRGLTSNNTLVLINGHRTANYPLADDGERTFTDLNTLPMDAVDQIQILKDGASSIYGADAIAGVVNIILKQNYQGMEGYAQGGTSQHGGGTGYHASATLGIGDIATDRYNFFVNVEYDHQEPIKVSQRDFPFNTNDLSSIGGLNNIAGQPGNFSGSIYGSVAPATVTIPNNPITHLPPNPLPANFIQQSTTNGPTQILAPGGCGPLGTPSTDASGNVFCEQNLLSNTYHQARATREGIYARGSFNVSNDMQLYIDMSYFQYQYYNQLQPQQIQVSTPQNTNQIVLPARLIGANGPGTGALNPNNPFANSPTCVEGVTCTDAAINYAWADIPSFESTVSHVLWSTLGVNGDWDGWTYSGALRIAHSWLDFTEAGFPNYNQLITDINNGSYNFLNPSANTPALRQALAPNLNSMSTNDTDSLDLSAYRSVFDLPGGPASLGVGLQYRTEDNHNPSLNPDNAAQGLGNTFMFGSRNLISIFGELDLPAFEHFDAVISARFDHYSDFGDTFNPKGGIKYSPFPWITIRATASSGFRAPGFAENGNAQTSAFVTTTAANIAPPSFAAEHGNSPYVTNPYSLNVINSAFPGVKPETSANYTGGFIVNPLENIAITADYYYIQKWNLIQPPSTGTALAAYFAGAPLPPGFAVTPDAVDPAAPNALARPASVVAPYSNSGRLVTDGIDLGITASWDLPEDVHYTLSFEGTHVFRFVDEVPGNPRLEFVGTLSPCILVDCEGTPRNKFTWGNDFKWGPWDAAFTTYFTSNLENIESDIAGPGGMIYPNVPGQGGDYWQVDLHVAYQWTDNVQVYGNIFNLLDADPPLEPAQYGGVNYNPSSAQGGIVGRFFQVGVRLKM